MRVETPVDAAAFRFHQHVRQARLIEILHFDTVMFGDVVCPVPASPTRQLAKCRFSKDSGLGSLPLSYGAGDEKLRNEDDSVATTGVVRTASKSKFDSMLPRWVE